MSRLLSKSRALKALASSLVAKIIPLLSRATKGVTLRAPRMRPASQRKTRLYKCTLGGAGGTGRPGTGTGTTAMSRSCSELPPRRTYSSSRPLVGLNIP